MYMFSEICMNLFIGLNRNKKDKWGEIEEDIHDVYIH